MSLINQTLKELDKRRQESDLGSLPIQETPGVMVTARLPKKSAVKPMLFALGLLIAGAAYWGMQDRKRTMTTPAIVSAPAPATSEPATATAPTPPTTSTPPATSTGSPPPNNAPTARINSITPAAQTATQTATTSPTPASSPAVNKSVTPIQEAENLYRQAIASLRSNQEESGREQLRKALALNPNHHDARLLLARSLIDARQPVAARTVLQDGLALSPQRAGFYMAIAHSHIQFNEIDPALSTLQQGLPFATNDAEYNALLAALYQRKNRHEDAARHYLVALRQSPDTANWLVGLGISLQATKNNTAAAEAFQRALDLGGLSPNLTATAQEQLKKLVGRP